ncbi:Gfo/Idh/MocA family protein [Lysobacter korlensis]|uniref:Gfo/Idh/MocA family protein n=1 Tax=Lysobacter korlensis TaxID=553636 RepID=A0ABV6RTI7_9GAMM
MTYFDRRPTSGGPVRVALIGAGGMGRHWLRLLHGDPDTELVGLVDLDRSVAQAAAESIGRSDLRLGTSLTEVVGAIPVDAVVNVTVPEAHLPVNLEALGLGLPVLCEKPIVPTVGDALVLAAAAEVAGRLVMTSQSRRYFRSLNQFRAAVSGLGDIAMVTTDFQTGPHFGGFRDRMQHPLLLDMAIHAFDACRHLLSADPVAVYCEEFNPTWSWYDGDAAAVAVFEMEHGTRFVFTGSWCNEGLPTSWNGQWTARGAGGSATWDGLSAPAVDGAAAEQASQLAMQEDSAAPEEIAGALAGFLSALRTGATPYGDIHSNVWSLAMVQAAVESAERGARIPMGPFMGRAYEEALDSVRDPIVRGRLSSWGTARAGLAAHR